MMHFSVLTKDGATRCEIPSPEVHVIDARTSSTFMSNDTLSIVLTSKKVIDFSISDTITIEASKYRLNQAPQIKRSGTIGGYEYSLTLESVKYDLINCRFLLPDAAVGDTMTANLNTMVQQVVDNANRVYGPGTWLLQSCPVTDVITQKFTEMNCLAALQAMCNAFEKDYNKLYEFRVEEANDCNIIIVEPENSGKVTDVYLTYGHKGGLYSITRQSANTENLVSRLFVYGSSENLPTGYRHSRLCIPGATRNNSYVDSEAAQRRYGIKEGFSIFDNIKPRAVFQVDNVRVIQNPNIEARYNISIRSNALATNQPYGFYAEDVWGQNDYNEWLDMFGYNDIGVTMRAYYDRHILNSKKYIADGDMTVTFNTGNCAGISFKVMHGSTDSQGNLTLVTRKENADRADSYFMPSINASEPWTIAIGDEFAISDILTPMALVRKAEDELLKEAVNAIETREKVNARYSVDFDEIAKANIDFSNFKPGNFIGLQDQSLDINDRVKITRVDKDFLRDRTTIEVSTIPRKQRIAGSATSEFDGTLSIISTGLDHTTTLTTHIEPNYESNMATWEYQPYNTLYIGAGKLTNWSLTGNRMEWTIGERIIGMDSNSKYDIYVQASKKTNYATIVLRKNRQIQVSEISLLQYDDQQYPIRDINPRMIETTIADDNSHYIKIGTISEAKLKSPKDPVRGMYRSINLIYGTTTSDETDVTIEQYGNLDTMRFQFKENYKNLQDFARAASQDIKMLRYLLQSNIEKIGRYDQQYCDDQKKECRIVDDSEFDIAIPEIK